MTRAGKGSRALSTLEWSGVCVTSFVNVQISLLFTRMIAVPALKGSLIAMDEFVLIQQVFSSKRVITLITFKRFFGTVSRPLVSRQHLQLAKRFGTLIALVLQSRMSVFMDFQIEPAISGKGAAILETFESFGGWWRWLFVGYVA